jgi:hypothetical protein
MIKWLKWTLKIGWEYGGSYSYSCPLGNIARRTKWVNKKTGEVRVETY